MVKVEVDNGVLTEVTSDGQSINFWITSKQSENESNYRWVYYNFP